MKVSVVTRREELAALVTRWDELAQKDRRDGFFRTSGWCLPWMKYLRPNAQPFMIVVSGDDGKIAGIAPLCALSYCNLGFRLRALSLPGREVVSGDFLDFVTEAESRPAVIDAVLDFLREAASKWSLLVMGEMIEGGDLHRAVNNMARRSGFAIRRQEERICPYIELPTSFDEYLASLTSSSRSHIRRRVREVIEKKGARIDVYSEPDEIVPRLNTLIRLHLNRWRSDNLPGTLGRPGFASFLREVCTTPPIGSRCRLYILTHRETPVAALLAFHFSQSALYYQAGWDPDSPLAQHSPGVVIMARSISDAIDQGLRYYEFLRGDESYKSRWTRTYRNTITLLVARSFMARGYLHTAQLKDLLKGGVANCRSLVTSVSRKPVPRAEA